VLAQPGALLTGRPPVFAPRDASAIEDDRARFDLAWERGVARARHAQTGMLLSRPAWSSVHVVAADSTRLLSIPVGALSRHTGVVFVDGDLRVDGTLQLQGVLLVRGDLQVGGALDVLGAVLVRGDGTSRIGAQSGVRYSPCAVQRALADVAQPTLSTFASWITR
jgi:hypothetical protein